eukprot:g4730.t1
MNTSGGRSFGSPEVRLRRAAVRELRAYVSTVARAVAEYEATQARKKSVSVPQPLQQEIASAKSALDDERRQLEHVDRQTASAHAQLRDTFSGLEQFVQELEGEVQSLVRGAEFEATEQRARMAAVAHAVEAKGSVLRYTAPRLSARWWTPEANAVREV